MSAIQLLSDPIARYAQNLTADTCLMRLVEN